MGIVAHLTRRGKVLHGSELFGKDFSRCALIQEKPRSDLHFFQVVIEAGDAGIGNHYFLISREL